MAVRARAGACICVATRACALVLHACVCTRVCVRCFVVRFVQRLEYMCVWRLESVCAAGQAVAQLSYYDGPPGPY